ncbi:MAG TPA: formate dehydrogenase accessory sulfurtransferase FdhD [Burkholderiaceae bacterium]|nr:formate dehydrogenase accessory sulfurtransferase FdhD [Burkholderiaceae bacterium]
MPDDREHGPLDVTTAPPRGAATWDARAGAGAPPDDEGALPPRTQRAALVRRRGATHATAVAELAEETAIALEFNGIAGAVMLATPADLEDFAVGFALTEGIVERASEIYAVEPRVSARGLTLEIDLAAEAFQRMKARRRVLAGRTGCGLCGIDSLEQAIRPLPPRFGRGRTVHAAAFARALRALGPLQPLHAATGASHAVAFCDVNGEVVLLREDVGRHNALDKLVGALARSRTDAENGFILVTSRASTEMVQKAAMARATILVAASAPTAAATRIAAEAGLTLAGFARGDDFNLYAHPERVLA